MFLRRLQGLFAVKMWCENGEMVMRCSVFMLGLLHFGFKKWRKRMRLRRLRCEFQAFSTLKSAKSYCIFGECGGGFLYFGCQCGGW